MNRVRLECNFSQRKDYRLLAVDQRWVSKLNECINFSELGAGERGTKRHREEETIVDNSSTTVALVLKGVEHLCAHDDASTFDVRRVEYSNSLLLARREMNQASVPHDESQSLYTASFRTAEELREKVDSVVVSALERIFEANSSRPQFRALALLKESFLTLEEVEPDVLLDGSMSLSQHPQSKRLYTFQDLAQLDCGSPGELAVLLGAAGAVVHRGYVRLLHPTVLHEALTATLTFLDSADESEGTWEAVRQFLCPALYPPIVVDVLRTVYGIAATSKEENSQDIALDRPVGAIMSSLLCIPKVLISLAEMVFEERPTTDRHVFGGVTALSLPLDDFLAAWLGRMPDFVFGSPATGIPPRGIAKSSSALLLSLLNGYAICVQGRQGSYVEATVHWVPRDDLPADMDSRLDLLFDINPQRWDAPSLKAYMEPLLPPGKSFEHIIVHYAREYRIPGEPVMYSRLKTF